MDILVLLPLISLLLTVLIIRSIKNGLLQLCDFREAVIYSICLNSIAVVLITELLSVWNVLIVSWLAGTWTIIVLVLVVYTGIHKLFTVLRSNVADFVKLIRTEKLLWSVLLLLSISGIIAIVYPANNYDSLTYHMARVAHWEQQAGISYYKTHIIRQLVFPPFAEYVLLNLQILTGGDRFANAVQLFFLGGAVLTISLIVRELRGNRRQQIIAAVIGCFIPMAVLQSNTTQNDIVEAFFVVAFLYFSMKLWKQTYLITAVFAGITLGLAWFTKGTGYMYTCVFCGWYSIVLIRKYQGSLCPLLKTAAVYAVVPLLAISINSGMYYRNIFFDGTLLGNAGEGAVLSKHNPKGLAFVALKNVMNHLPVTAAMKKSVYSMGVKWGIDPDDPAYNMTGMSMMVEGWSFHEDYGQNFLHLLLIIIFLVFFFGNRNSYSRSSADRLLFVISLLILSILFTVLLEWQPWSNRLQMPLFMLFSVFLGIEIGKIRKPVAMLTYIPVICYGFIALALNSKHPILPITQSMLTLPYRHFIYDEDMLPLQHYLDQKPYTRIGIYIGSDSWDYPYYKLLRNSGGKTRQLKHIFVENRSAMYLDDFKPEALLSIHTSGEKFNYKGRDFYKTKVLKGIAVFEPR